MTRPRPHDLRRTARLAAGIVALLLLAACRSAPRTPAEASPTAAARRFLTSRGTRFVLDGRPIVFYGSSFYPAPAGGTAAWHRPTFPAYIDRILALQAEAGLNVVRPTDYWTASDAGQTMTDSVLWANMDYLVRAARARGIWVEMDLSTWKKYLESKHLDPYDAMNWNTFIDWVGARYRDEPDIAFWYLSGEPPAPRTLAECDAMVSFFRAITDRMRAVDPNHLIAAGGFNHMNDERACDWWQRLYRLPNNQVLGYKTYSANDLKLTKTITDFGAALQKPMIVAEFGEPQGVGDCAWSGVAYNRLELSRTAFYRQVYELGRRGGVAGFLFWNLGPEIGDHSYEVSPAQPCLWREVTAEAMFAR